MDYSVSYCYDVETQWGLFSMKIPGRVGYQCSNFYRQLIREGVVIDDNYFIDEKNQLSFRFKSRSTGKQSTKKPKGVKVPPEDEPFDVEAYAFDYGDDDENCLRV